MIIKIGQWADVKLQRDFFCKFAKLFNFNPLVADNWYSVSANTFFLYKVYFIVLFIFLYPFESGTNMSLFLKIKIECQINFNTL